MQENPVTNAIHNSSLDINDGIQGSIVLPSLYSETRMLSSPPPALQECRPATSLITD